MSIWTRRSQSLLVRIWSVASTRKPSPCCLNQRLRLWNCWKSHAKKRPDFPTAPQPLIANDRNYDQKQKADISLAKKIGHLHLLRTHINTHRVKNLSLAESGPE